MAPRSSTTSTELPQSLQRQAAARARGQRRPPHRRRRRRARSTSASSRDEQGLAAEVDAGRFRRDLYFRLAGATFTIPPLRERKDEILPLAEQFVASAAGPLGRTSCSPTKPARGSTQHDWPGNIRELRNACERAVLLAPGSVIEKGHLTHRRAEAPARPRSAVADDPPPPGITLRRGDMPTPGPRDGRRAREAAHPRGARQVRWQSDARRRAARHLAPHADQSPRRVRHRAPAASATSRR